MTHQVTNSNHNKYAPYWAIAMAIFLILGLGTINLNWGNFWKGYVLDMVGPAWVYILFRGLFTGKANNFWTRFWTPLKTFLVLFSVLVMIEMAQYFKLYDGTFDPFDLLAYVSLLLPIFILDLLQNR